MSLPYQVFQKKAAKHPQIVGQHMKVSYSQYAEDFIIGEEILKGTLPNVGLYVDIGAFHPIEYSNTMLLTLLGWKGVNIDANPESIQLFEAMRPDDINVLSGVSHIAETLTYYIFPNQGMNTFSTDLVKKRQKEGIHPLETLTVPCRSINDILEEVLSEDQQIDYMNIDLEGFDTLVVEGLNWTRYQPTLVSLEAHHQNIEDHLRSVCHQRMVKEQYALIAFWGLSVMYLRKS